MTTSSEKPVKMLGNFGIYNLLLACPHARNLFVFFKKGHFGRKRDIWIL